MEDPTKFKTTSPESKEKVQPPRLFSDQQLSLLKEHDIFKYSSKFLYALSKASETPDQTFDLPYNPNLLSNINIQNWENFPEKDLKSWRRGFDGDMSFFSRGEGGVMEEYIRLYKEHPDQAMDLQNQIEVKSPLGHRGSSMFRAMNTTPFGGYLRTNGMGESLLLSSLNQANNLRDGVNRFFHFVAYFKNAPDDILNLQQDVFRQFLLYSEYFLSVTPKALTVMARNAEWSPTEIDSNIPQEEQDITRENLLKISTILAKSDNEFSLLDKNVKEVVGNNEERLELIRTWGRKLKEILDSVIPIMEVAHKYLEANVTYIETGQ